MRFSLPFLLLSMASAEYYDIARVRSASGSDSDCSHAELTLIFEAVDSAAGTHMMTYVNEESGNSRNLRGDRQLQCHPFVQRQCDYMRCATFGRHPLCLQTCESCTRRLELTANEERELTVDSAAKSLRDAVQSEIRNLIDSDAAGDAGFKDKS